MRIQVCDTDKEDASCDVRIVRGKTILPALDTSAYRGAIPAITPLYEDDGYLCASAVMGERVVTQRALSLNASYAYRSGDALQPFLIGDTLCIIAVDTDALRPEIYRAAALRGVKVVFCVRLFAEADYCEDYVLFGPWSNAQANNLFVVDVNNVETNAICPCALSKDQSGFLARGEAGEALLALPIERFYEGQRSFPVFQSLNQEQYRAYFGRETP